MWASRFHRANSLSLPTPSWSLLSLLVLLQLSAWYLPIRSRLDQVVRAEQRVHQDAHNKKQWHWQVQQLRHDVWIDKVLFQTQLHIMPATHQAHWQLTGTASLVDWQALQETLQKRVFLRLRSVSWWLQNDGRWKGRLRFDVLPERANTRYQNWLPVRVEGRPLQIANWQLVSIMRQQGKASALMKDSYHHSLWVTEGSWLPELGASVVTISSKQVRLMSRTGALTALRLHPQGGAHD
ncbi:hypothetical protein MSP8887_01478 [Marinomonas spartinae]|uniref:hypothetical protein n=1 Tax=Marinomonas spartinae TaxID=1792290 RepID=UPI000808EFED|nr:hypothetical protein [Marinomonas spartinae]SBS31241.1 hypothetical protein MSP8887_01478 [Marinomonas spartinae]